jgi:hypothetical protein
MKTKQLIILSDINFTIDLGILIGIFTSIAIMATYIGILEYRFRRVEKHPFLRAIKQLQDEQLIDMARAMLRRDDT